MKGFVESLTCRAQAGFVPVIPDFKMVSPGEGPLFLTRDAVDAAVKMERSGAPAISVVTEGSQFGGSLELLSHMTHAVQIPVLRKDFIRSRADVEETARRGAKAILLICACMTEALLRELYQVSLDCGLETLVETHTKAELQFAASLGARLVGINNRDILALERDGGTVNTTAQLADGKPKDAFLLSESGILAPGDVRTAISSGADAVLVGTAIWKAADPFRFYEELSQAKEGRL